MCDPATLMSIAGTASSVLGGSSSTDAQSQALERDAAIARKEADFEKDRLAEEQRSLLGRQIVAGAKGGSTQSGSILEVMRGSAEQAELEALNVEFGAQAGIQSKLFEASQIKQAGKMEAATTLLTGASKSGAFN